MSKCLLGLLVGLLIFTSCSSSKKDILVVGTITSNEGVSISLGESLKSINKKLGGVSEGVNSVDNVYIISDDKKITVLGISSTNEWSTSEGIQIGDTKEEVIDAYSFLSVNDWDEKSDFSLDSDESIIISKKLGKDIYSVRFSFEDGKLKRILYTLF